MAEDNLFIPPLENNVLASIRQAITDFLQRCGLQYQDIILDEALHTECCQEAIKRGIPMDGKYSVLPYMDIGVAMIANAYAHIPERPTRIWICLVTAVVTGIDDHLCGRQDTEDMYRFNERFVNCHTQANPVLEALDTLLRETPRYYSPLASNLLTTSILDFMSSMLLDYKTKDMQVPTQTLLYPEYCRTLSGLSNLSAFMIFPSTIPIEDYIHSVPDLGMIIGYENDILSFYKEEIVGETANFVSLRAVSRGITKLDALHGVIDQTVHAHHNILESLKVHTEAYDAYVSFFHGYMRFHASARYKLAELIAERSSCNDA